MAVQTSNYQVLINKLDQFIRKYYLNQLIKGALYSIGLILLLFVAINTLEHFFYFDTNIRKGLFFTFIGASVVALMTWVFIPLLKYFRLGQVISHEQAANIIGDHFGNVKDKLLNILQLKHQADTAPNADLIMAGINQKTEEIKLVPFKTAINLGNNKKYLRYALPPLLLLLTLLIAAPSMITDSTNRIINNDTDFERPAPFHFVIEEEDLEVIQFGDYTLNVNVEGEVLPNEVFIDIDNYKYRLNKIAPGQFAYQFSNIQKNTDFKFFSVGVESEDYTLKMIAKPNIVGFDVKLDYPGYIGRTDETLANIGDVIVPIGTKIDWVFNTQNTDDLQLQFSSNKDLTPAKRFSDKLFTYQKKALKDEGYKLFISNAALPKADSISYRITVIPDQHPTIKVKKFTDSLDAKMIYFAGSASDDYGLKRLSFNYRTSNKTSGKQGQLVSVPMKNPDNKQIQYDYNWDIELLELKPGDEITYYFEVYDNDAVNGNKSARTNLMIYAMPTVEEFEDMAEKNNEAIKDNLEKSLEEVKKIQQEMKKAREKLLQEKELNWQDKKELEKLLERQKELEKMMEQAKKDFQENMKNQQEFEKPKEELLEKQEKLEKMMDELMSDEMKELMEKIEELMQKLEKEDALEMMEQMEQNDEELEKELDRMMEMFKQLEMEYEMEKQIDKLEELAEKQEELAEKTEEQAEKTEEKEEKGEELSQEEQQKQEELKKEQEALNKEFEDLQEKQEELQEKNKEMEHPMPMEEEEEEQEEMEDIQEDMEQSEESLDQQKNKKASKSQKQAAQKMKQKAKKMQEQMESGEMEQMEEDMEALRQLLENLVGLSFDQEDLINGLRKTAINTPKYVEGVQQQYKLKDDFKLIEDSLQELSKRVYQIESFVTEKVTEVKSNIRESIDNLEERRIPQANDHQQRSMQNVNDLALMLSEVMDQMQQQMSSMMSGSQMCNKPGQTGQGKKGKVPMDKISQGQKSLNDQMKEMKEGLEKAGQGKAQSKQFAEMAAKQAALRKALRDAKKQMQEQGQGKEAQGLDDILDGMDKIEIDLVNKRLNNDMLKRQEQIMTRLLEAEKAQREREYDNKRKAESGAQKERPLPPSLEDYLKQREAEIDLYKSVSPALRPYYKSLVEEYFNSLKGK